MAASSPPGASRPWTIVATRSSTATSRAWRSSATGAWSARQLEVLRDGLVGLAPARGQPVGHAQQRDVGLDRLGLQQVAVELVAIERHLVDQKAQAEVMAREGGDVRAQPLAGAQALEHRA